MRHAERSVLKTANEMTEDIVKRKDMIPSEKQSTITQIKEQVQSVVESIYSKKHPESKSDTPVKPIEINDSVPQTLSDKMQA